MAESSPAGRLERTRTTVRRGALPRALSAKAWVGPGSGAACAGCGDPITRQEREFEVQSSDALTFRLHPECYRTWMALSGHRPTADGDQGVDR